MSKTNCWQGNRPAPYCHHYLLIDTVNTEFRPGCDVPERMMPASTGGLRVRLKMPHPLRSADGMAVMSGHISKRSRYLTASILLSVH
jgi:hypothetical protein